MMNASSGLNTATGGSFFGASTTITFLSTRCRATGANLLPPGPGPQNNSVGSGPLLALDKCPHLLVKYTTDQSSPATSATAKHYSAPFEISASTTIRALISVSGEDRPLIHNATFTKRRAGKTDDDVDPNTMRLVLMPSLAKSKGAVCLDGSPGGFYWRPATDPAHANDWLFHFKGAGWCYDEADCLSRSKMGFGSSKFWTNTTNGWSGGILSPADKDFGAFNKVILLYCDGASFTGDRAEPLSVQDPDGGTSLLYFRGLRILHAAIETLQGPEFGLTKAKTVLLTGCSSGGLATYLHQDALAARLRSIAPGIAKLRSAPVSGFFLQHNSVDGLPVYQKQMANIFKLSNSSGGVNQACIADRPEDRHWECMFAQNSYNYTKIATFVENSALDMWQTGCIFTAAPIAGFPNAESSINGNCSAVPGWRACASNPENCTSTQMATMNGYMDAFVGALNRSAPFHAPGFGAFVHSCHDHCDGIAGGYPSFKIGGVTMQQATSKW